MEAHNALILFRRSRDFGLVYSHYVSDGDASVFPALQAADIYQTTQISKIECSNHIQKRASGRVFKFGKWYLTEFEGEPGTRKNGGKGVKK